MLIERTSRARYSNLAAAIARVQRGVNESLGLGAHFVLKETDGFYIGPGAPASTAVAPASFADGNDSESEDSESEDSESEDSEASERE